MADGIDSSKYKYKNEAFDKLLTDMLYEMTEEQKNRLPKDLLRKIFKSKDPNINQLTDAQKDYIFAVGFNRPIIKTLLDVNNGISIEQFAAFVNTWNKRKNSDINAEVVSEQMIVNGEFVLAGKDLYEALSYKSLVCHSPVFKIVLNAREGASKFRNKRSVDMTVWMDHLIRMIAHYESNKKRLVMEFGLKNMSEWYCLLHFYSAEKRSSTVYKENFKYAFSSNVQCLRNAMAKLKREGYLEGRGSSKHNLSSISIKGRDLVDRMLTKYILNY